MEFVFVIALGCALGWLTSLVLRRTIYRQVWVEHGREDALLRYHYRFKTKTRWIQKYYDEGYDAVINEKEAVNV